MRKIALFLFAIFTLVSSLKALSKGCYEIYKIDKIANIDTAVFVLIDETTHFDNKLQNQILSNALSFAKSSNHLFIGKFSALINGGYNQSLFEFTIDTPLSDDERYDISKSLLTRVDKCLKDQIGFVRKSVENAINIAFSEKI